MSEKAKAMVAETVDQLNKLPESKKDKAKQMMEAFAAGIALGAELITMRTERKDEDAPDPKAG